MAKIRRVLIGPGTGLNLPLLLTSICMALGFYVVSHPGILR